jgi:hypothetical protein
MIVEWWAWVFVVFALSLFVIDRFLARKKFTRGEYGWYLSGLDGANSKAHCFLYTGECTPLISIKRYYSFCRRKGMSYWGNWKRIENPTPDIMCTKCMDFIKRKKKHQRRE